MDVRENEKRQKEPVLLFIINAKMLKILREILKCQNEIFYMKHPMSDDHYTETDLEQARAYPFSELHEFRGKNAWCPFHQGKTMALRHYPEGNTVHCFACGKSWDTIGFLMERDGLTFVKAVRMLL